MPTKVSVLATWMDPTEPNGLPLQQLAFAAKQLLAGRNDAMMVPANTAVELTVTELFDSAFGGFSLTRKAHEDFRRIGFARLMSTIIPLLAHMLEKPALKPDIQRALADLRSQRYHVGHRGLSGKPEGRSAAGRLFTAAVFGFRYAMFLGSFVEEAKQTGRLLIEVWRASNGETAPGDE